MKNRKFAYLLLGAAALAGLTACGASTNKSSTDKNDGNTFKITTVRWSDWGEDYHKGFLDDSAKESGIKIKWDTLVAAFLLPVEIYQTLSWDPMPSRILKSHRTKTCSFHWKT